MGAIDWSQYTNVVILTGAGVSVASGLKPFRGPGGIWEQMDHPLEEKTLDSDPQLVWEFFSTMRKQALSALPNAAHHALAKIETSFEGQWTLITQNVDGLHQRAGSLNVIELHGSLYKASCRACQAPLDPLKVPQSVALPGCEVCGGVIRPDVVLFGEYMPAEPEWLSKRALRDCDLFVAIGTSGTVSPASNFVRGAKYAGAHTILVNLEPMNPPNPAFDRQIIGRAEDILPQLLGVEAP